MDSKFGVSGTTFDNIFFTEDIIINAKIIEHLRKEISLQNSNLSEIKKLLASEAKSVGATTIMNFKYGQQKHKTWELLFSFKWDTESWYGEGDAVNIINN